MSTVNVPIASVSNIPIVCKPIICTPDVLIEKLMKKEHLSQRKVQILNVNQSNTYIMFKPICREKYYSKRYLLTPCPSPILK